jgi:hypothetical protein
MEDKLVKIDRQDGIAIVSPCAHQHARTRRAQCHVPVAASP